jgi:uncharacterized protein YcbX
LGERLDEAFFDVGGTPFDRSWAVWLPGRKRPLSAKREPLLFEGRSRIVDERDVVVTLPTGVEAVAGDPVLEGALTEWLGYQATLGPAPDGHVFDDSPVHILTTSSLAAMRTVHPSGEWDPRRFRPSIVIDGADDGFPEEEWLGGRVAVGAASFEVTHPCTRCTMVGLAQSDLHDDLAILEQVMAHNDEVLGVYAKVSEPDRVRVGDEVHIVGAV